MHLLLETLLRRYPDLEVCVEDIQRAEQALEETFRRGGKLLVCGNGGSAADSEHIVGELMKGFLLKRELSGAAYEVFQNAFPEDEAYLATHLQGALPAISLSSQGALATAVANDMAPDMVFAQQVYGYGKAGDVVLGISTSGNSRNVCRAMQVGHALRLSTIGLTGADGGALTSLCDIVIRVPWHSVIEIQERHLPIYHTICALVEEHIFHEVNAHRN